MANFPQFNPMNGSPPQTTPVLPPPRQSQPIAPIKIAPDYQPSPLENLAIKVVLAVSAVFIALGALTLCAALGPPGYAAAAVIIGVAVGVMIKNNVFGSRDALLKICNFAKTKFLAMKTHVQNRLNPPPPPPVEPIVLQQNAPVDPVRTSRVTEIRNTKTMHEQELSEIYQEHLNFENGDPEDIDLLDGLIRSETIKRGVIQTQYVDPATKKVVYEFNRFEPGFDNGPSVDHFMERLSLIAQTLEKNVPEGDSERVRKQFEDHYITRLQDALKEGVDVPIGTGFTPENQEILRTRFNAAKEVLQEAFGDASQVVASYGKTENFIDLEKELIVQRGRPTIINTFQVPGDGTVYFSAQMPLLEKTIPSSIRNQEGLCNAAMTFTGVVSDDGGLKVLHEASRHSSIPPIAIEDVLKRQCIANQNVMQELQQIVRRKVGDHPPLGNSKAYPVELDWNTMILLTPKTVDNARNKSKGWFGTWKGEGETLMLKESIKALYFYANRPVEVDVGGQKIWVKMNISAMNLGCNTAVVPNNPLGKLPNAKTVGGLNAQGFMEFEIQTDHHLKIAFEDDIELSRLFNEYCQLKEHQHNLDFFEVKKEINDQLAVLQNSLKDELDQSTPDRNIINELNGQIHALQKSLRKQAKGFYSKKLNAYETRAEEIRLKREQIDSVLQNRATELKNSLEGSDDYNSDDYNLVADKIKGLRNAFLLLRNQAEFAQSLYNGDYRRPETVMRSQAIYIESISLMNSWVSFFCKSGEDRTGAVDIETATRVISGWKGADEKQAKITLFDTSISRQITRENSNAEGMQISAKLVPEEIRLRVWLHRKIAKLAKGITTRDAGFVERVKGIFGKEKRVSWLADPEVEIEAGLEMWEEQPKDRPPSVVLMADEDYDDETDDEDEFDGFILPTDPSSSSHSPDAIDEEFLSESEEDDLKKLEPNELFKREGDV